MDGGKRNVEELLLDWHLDRLSAEDRARIEAELRHDARLRARSDRLRNVLQPLDYWRAAPAPPGLADGVLARLEESKQGARQPVVWFPAEEGGGRRRFPFGSLRDLVAAAACIVVIAGLSAIGLTKLRERSRRTMCAGNLRSVFLGTSAYQNAFAGSLPFAGSVPGASWLPDGARGRPYASNSRHVYLLVRGPYGLRPKDFICPAAGKHEPMRMRDCAAYDDFPAACNISYATLNLAGLRPNLRPSVRIAYIGDANPLFVNARFNESVDPDNTNSPAHRGRGQNVLLLDGSVRWMVSPIYGPGHDNLWLIGNIRRYTGTETPVADDDAQLVPGYPATDPLVSRTVRQ